MKKKKLKKWCGYYAPASEKEIYRYVFGNTRKEVLNEIPKCWCGKKDCEMNLAQWFVLKTKDMLKVKNFGDVLKFANYKEIKTLNNK